MVGPNRSLMRIIEDQCRAWQMGKQQAAPPVAGPQVITVSREPGSGGKLVAAGIAKSLGYDLFHREVLHEMAKSADMNRCIMETLDEKGLSVLDEWIASLVDARHLWPDRYLQHLMRVVGAIGKHGRAVLVGRGANFILPPEMRFRVRVIAPREDRIKNVSREFSVSEETARRRVLKTESERKAFIRKYFHADISDPVNYDLVINTEALGLDAAVSAVIAAIAVSREQGSSIAA
ncbi:MAG: cytidylate kinase-like family protein [Pseudomonadota bacterium]